MGGLSGLSVAEQCAFLLENNYPIEKWVSVVSVVAIQNVFIHYVNNFSGPVEPEKAVKPWLEFMKSLREDEGKSSNADVMYLCALTEVFAKLYQLEAGYRGSERALHRLKSKVCSELRGCLGPIIQGLVSADAGIHEDISVCRKHLNKVRWHPDYFGANQARLGACLDSLSPLLSDKALNGLPSVLSSSSSTTAYAPDADQNTNYSKGTGG